jgi:murein DD-endopeptidase MepM/ murein hydrolase activator NlpD
MFIEAMADAVAKGGGLGIARMLQDSMGEAGGVDPSAAEGGVMSADLLAEAEAPDRPPAAGSGSGFPHGPPKGAANRVTSSFGHRSDPLDGKTFMEPSEGSKPPAMGSGGGPAFARRDKFHAGIDLRGAAGDPIRAVGEGVVRRAGPRGGYGNAVEVDHGGGVTTLYAHASEVLVNPGERVAAQQEIARVGQSGRATGPHLHFEVRHNDRQVDPTRYAGVVHRALNAYQQRAEDTVKGNSGPLSGDGQ